MPLVGSLIPWKFAISWLSQDLEGIHAFNSTVFKLPHCTVWCTVVYRMYTCIKKTKEIKLVERQQSPLKNLLYFSLCSYVSQAPARRSFLLTPRLLKTFDYGNWHFRTSFLSLFSTQFSQHIHNLETCFYEPILDWTQQKPLHGHGMWQTYGLEKQQQN